MALVKVAFEVGSPAEARAATDVLEGLDLQPAVATTAFEAMLPAAARPDARATPTRCWRIEAYYDGTPELQLLAAALSPAGVQPPQLRIEEVPDANWVALSQAALPPVEAARFIVHGSHDRAKVGHRIGAIEIDAGEAFGTAHHASTFGCLVAIDRLARQRAFARVLDLGCGSAVLAIAAARALPRASVIAGDIDPVAVAVARGNIRRNRLEPRIRVVASVGLSHPALRSRRFDLIIANILADPLIHLVPQMQRSLASGGIVVLAGILATEADAVGAAYRAAGMPLVSRHERDGWTTLVAIRA